MAESGEGSGVRAKLPVSRTLSHQIVVMRPRHASTCKCSASPSPLPEGEGGLPQFFRRNSPLNAYAPSPSLEREGSETSITAAHLPTPLPFRRGRGEVGKFSGRRCCPCLPFQSLSVAFAPHDHLLGTSRGQSGHALSLFRRSLNRAGRHWFARRFVRLVFRRRVAHLAGRARLVGCRRLMSRPCLPPRIRAQTDTVNVFAAAPGPIRNWSQARRCRCSHRKAPPGPHGKWASNGEAGAW